VRFLGLDVGDVRIGVALSDETATLASGLPTLTRVGPRKDVRAIARIVREQEVAEVVVGMPWRLDGTAGSQAEKVMAFAEALRRGMKVPVSLWDERLTSVAADALLAEAGVRRKDRKEKIDRAAAVLILQGYLDARVPAPVERAE
jgi:putative Holliday junction resolvase